MPRACFVSAGFFTSGYFLEDSEQPAVNIFKRVSSYPWGFDGRVQDILGLNVEAVRLESMAKRVDRGANLAGCHLRDYCLGPPAEIFCHSVGNLGIREEAHAWLLAQPKS